MSFLHDKVTHVVVSKNRRYAGGHCAPQLYIFERNKNLGKCKFQITVFSRFLLSVASMSTYIYIYNSWLRI